MTKLDIGCGGKKQEGFTGIDYRPLEGVDIVHDLELVPWPLEDNSVITAIASHVVEHIKPWLTITFMNEVWRVLTAGGTFAVATPYAGSPGYWQDPSHCNGWNEATFQYFDPRYPLYWIYQPSPWKIVKGFPVWQATEILSVLWRKYLMPRSLLMMSTLFQFLLKKVWKFLLANQDCPWYNFGQMQTDCGSSAE